MRFAHLKINHRFERMRLRGLTGARDEFHLAAMVQNLKTLPNLSLAATAGQASCCVCHVSAVPQTYPRRPKRLIAPTPRVPRRATEGKTKPSKALYVSLTSLIANFFNGIDPGCVKTRGSM